MLTVFVYSGEIRVTHHVDPAWLADPAVLLWVDVETPTDADARVLQDVFRFHELAVEDALAELHNPKVEAYPDFLYIVLHGIDFEASRHCFATHEVDFFLGARYLVTVHDGSSRSIARWRDACPRNSHVLAEGPAALLHRIVDVMVDNYEPEVDKIEQRLETLESEVFERPGVDIVRRILELKKDISSLRRITTPQRDVVGRLARREFPLVSDTVAYRFRDVYDHLVRFNDEALAFQDRVTGLLDAHLSSVSNRLNEIMKVLALLTTVFGPLTVLSGLYGMNIPLPRFPGGDHAQFWWVVGVMAAAIGVMLWYFRRRRWI